MSNDTDQLSRALRDHSEQMAGRSLDLGDVKGRARSIRRRRQALTGAVAAVVLAVAAPVAITVTDAFDAQPVPPADRTETPNPDRTDNAQPEPSFPEEPVVLTAQGLPEGESPAVNYIRFDKGQLVTPSGTFDLPEQTGSVARYGDGWIALGGESEVRWLDADMNVIRSERTTSINLAVSDDGSRVAWVEGWFEDPEVQLVAAPTTGGEPRSWSIPIESAEVRPVGFLGDDRVVFTIVETSRSAIAEPDGSFTELEGFLFVRSASEASGLVAGLTEYSTNRACDGVMDASGGTTQMLWETCDYQLGEFSPDGRYVIGKVVQDDMSARAVAVLDARTGEVLARFVSEPDDLVAMHQVVWEDADSLLAVAHAIEPNEGHVLRLDLDGTLERTGITGTFENMGIPFAFATYRY
jgi:hypothetical protein